jgi:hypothetical protein
MYSLLNETQMEKKTQLHIVCNLFNLIWNETSAHLYIHTHPRCFHTVPWLQYRHTSESYGADLNAEELNARRWNVNTWRRSPLGYIPTYMFFH